MKKICVLFSLLVAALWGSERVETQASARSLQFPAPPHRDAIGTHIEPLTRSDPSIETFVKEVTLSEPVRIRRGGLDYFEVRGTIEGVGWGGENGYVRLESHYTYKIPYVLRVPTGWRGTLVVFRPGSAPIVTWKGFERMYGARSVGRIFHEYGDRLISDVVLHPARQWAFFAANLTPFALDGQSWTFSLPGTDDDNDGRIDEDPAQDDDRDGLEDEDPRDGVDNDADGLVDEDPAVDDDGDGRLNEDPGRTTVMAVLDPTIARDTTFVAKHLLETLTGRLPTVTLGVGHSAGSNMYTVLNTGIDPPRGLGQTDRASGRVIRVGDNFVKPYDRTTPKIFDGFMAFGGGGGASSLPIDSAAGISAPTLFLAGEADAASITAVRQVKEMLDRGLSPMSWSRIYMARNVSHIDSDFVRGNRCGAPCAAQPATSGGGGDRWKPLAAALLDALWRWVVNGTAPPQSIVNGSPVDLNGDGTVDSLRFPQSTRPGPAFSFSFPYVDDPSFDQAGPVASITNTQNNAGLATLWAAVQQSLTAQIGSIFLPETACRRGRFTFVVQGPTGLAFGPFDQQTFTSRWTSSAAHQTCRVRTVDALIARGLYDPTVVTIDVRPDQFPNRVDSRSSEQISVAIFTTIGFDATHINADTLQLGGASPVKGDHGEITDVNSDGRPDLLIHFSARDVKLGRPGEIVAELVGKTWSGIPFSGTDLVEFVE
jgi:hypothetical protein